MSNNSFSNNIAILANPEIFRYLIIHHNDDDGIGSGALVYQALKGEGITYDQVDTICSNYDFDKLIKILKDNQRKYSLIFLVDISFGPKNYEYLIEIASYSTEGAIWVDHHSTSMRTVANSLIREELASANICYNIDMSYCGAALLAKSYGLHNKDGSGFPDIIRYIDDHDRWRHNYPETLKFHYGFHKTIPNISDIRNPIWEQLFETSYDPDDTDNLLTKIILAGENIVDYAEEQYLIERNSLMIDTTITIDNINYHALIINHLGNSFVFGNTLDGVDIGIFFVLEKSLQYKYVITTTNPKIDCSILAQFFDGGGHVGIAGFRSKKDPVELFNLREK